MSKSTPTPPAPPDYAAANEAAVNADIRTLPLRNAINAAAQLGKSYTDPATGQTYDFTGLGSADVNHSTLMQQLADAPEATQKLLELQQLYGGKFAQSARDQLAITDPTGFALRDQLGARLGGGANSIESLYGSPGSPGLPGKPDYEAYIRSQPDLLANYNDNVAKNTNMTMAEYGQQHYTEHGQQEGRSLPTSGGVPGTPATNADGSSYVPQYEKISGNGPSLTNLANGPDFRTMANAPGTQWVGGVNLSDGTSQAAGRGELERQIFDELNKAGTPDMALQRSAEQAARARGAASGNILGDSAALQEALGVQLAQRQLDNQRRNDALSLLSSGQGTGDTANRIALAQQQADIGRASANNQANNQDFQNRLAATNFNNAAAQQDYTNQMARVSQNNEAANQAFQNAMNAINQRNQTQQNMFGAQQGLVAAKANARQQDLANVQSFLGLQPIVSQGSQLAGLQQGAAPFATGGGYAAMGTNQNAGAQGTAFASNIFGTQANIYNTQMQNSASPLGALAGGLAGSFFGGVGKTAGANLGSKLFS